MKYYLSIKLFLSHKTSSLTAFKTRWNIDWLTQQAFISDIPSQVHPSHKTRWKVILIFVMLYFQLEIKVRAKVNE